MNLNRSQWDAMRLFINELENRFHESNDSIEGGLKKLAELLSDASTLAKEMGRVHGELYPNLRDQTRPLALRGWFVSGNFGSSEIIALARQCGHLRDEQLDMYVADMYRSSIDEHGADIISRYPDRAFAIKPALDAHHRKEYALSVPTFFAHAEGIIFNELNKELFTRRPGKDGKDQHILEIANRQVEKAKKPFDRTRPHEVPSIFLEMMWLPFSQVLPVGYTEKERNAQGYTGLNRNTVMHGLDLNYATEENSLKAFSMLSHIASLVDQR